MCRNGKFIFVVLLLMTQPFANGYAADFKQCFALEIGKADLDRSLVKEVLKQAFALSKYGIDEDVSVDTLAITGQTTQNCLVGMVTSRTIFLTIKNFKSIDSEKTAQDVFLNLGNQCYLSHKYFDERLTDWLPLIKNQSIRDDVKKIKDANHQMLKKLTSCVG